MFLCCLTVATSKHNTIAIKGRINVNFLKIAMVFHQIAILPHLLFFFVSSTVLPPVFLERRDNSTPLKILLLTVLCCIPTPCQTLCWLQWRCRGLGMCFLSARGFQSTICKIHSQWEFAVWCREFKPILWDNLDGWDGVGGGKEV